MKLGILGGSFDPVHYGHLLLAECCREACQLDEVWFMPAARPPHKPRNDFTAAEHRVEMLRLAIGGHLALRVSDLEVQRGGTSYTVDTLRQLQETRPHAELFFLMGADSLRDLPTWRAPDRICELATPVVVRRADWEEPDFDVLAGVVPPDRLQRIRGFQVAMPLIELSSRELRQRVAQGKSIRYRTPRAVEKYIQTQRLYLS
jgi:nicotinate-nucleotide adenylyltransferase